MIEVLARHFPEVEVLSPGTGGESQHGNVRFITQKSPAQEKIWTNLAFKIFDGVTHHAWQGGWISVKGDSGGITFSPGFNLRCKMLSAMWQRVRMWCCWSIPSGPPFITGYPTSPWC